MIRLKREMKPYATAIAQQPTYADRLAFCLDRGLCSLNSYLDSALSSIMEYAPVIFSKNGRRKTEKRRVMDKKKEERRRDQAKATGGSKYALRH